MRCNKAKNLVSLAMDEPLAETDRIQIAHHLEACPGCREYQEDLHKCRQLIQQSETAPSANFEWKVQLGIQKALREAAARQSADIQPRRFWLPASASAVAAAVVIVAVGGAWLVQHDFTDESAGLQPEPQQQVSAPSTGVNPYLRDAGSRQGNPGATVVHDPSSPGVRRDWRQPPAVIFPVVRERSFSGWGVPSHLQYRPPGTEFGSTAEQDSLSSPLSDPEGQ